MARIDIHDVARLAGVSTSTVSKVLNRKDASISSETREKVLRVARENHYTPYSRRSTAKEWLLGVLVREHSSLDTILEGVLNTGQAHGYSTMVYVSNDDPALEEKYLSFMHQSGVLGIIWEPTEQPTDFAWKEAKSDELSLVVIGENGDDNSLLMPYETAGFHITKELINRGHKKIACLIRSGRRTSSFVKGFKRCLFENELIFSSDNIYSGVSSDLIKLISRGEITGVVCSHRHMAQLLQSELANLHYYAPVHYSLVSLRSDTGAAKQLQIERPISSLALKTTQFGSYACKQLISKIEKKPLVEQFEHQLALDNTLTIGSPNQLNRGHILVVGSINIDTRLTVDRLPSSGSTVTTDRSVSELGGKGANQAVGVARLGHQASLIGKVGDDSSSDVVYRTLQGWGVECSSVTRVNNADTGRAFIFVNPQGESMITVLSGANALLSAEDIRKNEPLFKNADFCLVQSEVPMAAVLETCKLAHKHAVKTVFKPVYCDELEKELLEVVDIIVPNERELERIAPNRTTLEGRAKKLLNDGVKTVLVTLGEEGVYLLTNEIEKRYSPVPCHAVDTTGAADAFISALVSCLLSGDSLDKAIQKSNYAAAYSTTRQGVVNSLIDKSALEDAFTKTNSPSLP